MRTTTKLALAKKVNENIEVRVKHNFSIKETEVPDKRADFRPCTGCQSFQVKKTKCPDIFQCKSCHKMFSDHFNFDFPEWASAPNAHFKRFICLVFNIQGERFITEQIIERI